MGQRAYCTADYHPASDRETDDYCETYHYVEPSLLFEPDEAYPGALVCRGEDGCGSLIAPMGDLSHRMFHAKIRTDHSDRLGRVTIPED